MQRERLETQLHLHVLLPLDGGCHGPVHPEHGVGGEEDDERLPALLQQRAHVLNSRAQVPHPVQAVQREDLICDRSKACNNFCMLQRRNEMVCIYHIENGDDHDSGWSLMEAPGEASPGPGLEIY